ncbi:MAG: hypothetical protein QW165_05495 [Candidatus Woesearchaeota archaeon]
MQKRGSVELWIFLAFVVIAFGGAVYTLLPQKQSAGMASIRSTWGSAYVPVVPGPGELRYALLQCQSTCHGTQIETPRHKNPQERRGGHGLQQCLAWCRNKWQVALAQQIPGQYDLDYIRVTQRGAMLQRPEVQGPSSWFERQPIPKATRDTLPPVVPVTQIG